VRCYVADPKLVVVDEASLGLSPLMVDRVFATFQELADGGTSLLIVEQYVNRALQMSDSVCLINHGEIIFTGDSSELNADTVFERYLGISVHDG
jgi:branched-chain amino acid transport system ATP-binding protein